MLLFLLYSLAIGGFISGEILIVCGSDQEQLCTSLACMTGWPESLDWTSKVGPALNPLVTVEQLFSSHSIVTMQPACSAWL